ncbi:DUF2304 domain-containing protein [Patescibacteria group bacterium]|nr:DUF2304 domain-containing protein [Patescibacteria group bacterium]MBU1722033.1 DUF2304 domain-containing protein [Patescibacteria group bacterium]MBU1901764.1 DUF2304 domain-containing protein [Patescibacteria group bacterium]
MIIIFQALFSIFVLFVLSTIVQKKKQGLLGKKGFLFWVVFWMIALLAVFWPESMSQLASFMGIGRGVDVVIYSALVIIFFLLFHLHIKIESIGRDITFLTREMALMDEKKNSKL